MLGIQKIPKSEIAQHTIATQLVESGNNNLPLKMKPT